MQEPIYILRLHWPLVLISVISFRIKVGRIYQHYYFLYNNVDTVNTPHIDRPLFIQ